MWDIIYTHTRAVFLIYSSPHKQATNNTAQLIGAALITSKCTYPPPPPSLPPSSPSSSSPIIFNTNNNPKQAHGRKLLRPHPLDQSCVAPAQEARQGRKGRRAHRQHQLDQWALAGFAFESWYVACFFSVLMDILIVFFYPRSLCALLSSYVPFFPPSPPSLPPCSLQRLQTRRRSLVQLPPPRNASFQHRGHGGQPFLARNPLCLAP